MENSVIEMTYYNSTDTCDKIKEDGNICGKSFYGRAFKEYDKSGKFTGKWVCHRQNKEFDHLIFYCGSKDHRHIEIIYILPWEEVLRRQSISIIRSYIYGWYEKYRIKDREKLKKINDIWGQILTVRR